SYFVFSDTIMSDSEDSTVTYTTVSSPCEGRSGDVSPDYVPSPEEPEQAPPSPVYIPYIPKPEHPEYIPLEDDVFPAEEQPLPAAALPITDSPGYIPESDPDKDLEDDDDEDPEEDPSDYLADHDDDDKEVEEPSGDDADEEDEEQDEDDDDEEEEHPALAVSIPPPPTLRVTASISSRPQPSTLFFTKEDAERFLAMPIPPPSPLTPLSSPLPSPLPQIPSPLLPASPLSSPYHYLLHHHPYSYYLLTIEQIYLRLPCHLKREAEIRRRIAEDIGYGIRDTWIDLRDVTEEEAMTTLERVNTRVTELVAVQEQDTQDIYGVIEDTQGTSSDGSRRDPSASD
nr:hypothetical protein [Tanacetum cinerariifolium]